MPSFEKVCVNRVHVPPYRLLAEMKFCPECTIVSRAAVIAAWPLEKTSPGRAAVERRQPLFENVVGGVHQAAVDVAELPQAEQIRRVLGVVEHVARGCVDRHGASRRCRVGHLTGVQCQSAKAVEGVLF